MHTSIAPIAALLLSASFAFAADVVQSADVFAPGESGWAVAPGGGSWDGVAGAVGGPYVVWGRAGYETSTDGITWSRPLFATNRRGDTVDVAEAAVANGTAYLRLVDGTVTNGSRVVAVGVSRLAPVGGTSLVFESGRGLEVSRGGVTVATAPSETLLAVIGDQVVGSGGTVMAAGGGPSRKVKVHGQRAAGGGQLVVTSAPMAWRDDSGTSWHLDGSEVKAVDNPSLHLVVWGAGAPNGSGGGEWRGIGLTTTATGAEVCGEDQRGALCKITVIPVELGTVRGITSMGRDGSGRLRVLAAGSAGVAIWRER